jgi:hypothetical protein
MKISYIEIKKIATKESKDKNINRKKKTDCKQRKKQ